MKKIRIVSLILGCLVFISCFSSCGGYQDFLNFGSESKHNTDDVISTTEFDTTEPSDSKEEVSVKFEYETGNQIELYLNSTLKSIYDFIDPNPNSINIKDTDIVEFQNGKLVPKKQGITYVSCKYGTILKNYNIIVHKGAETVTAWQIDNTNSGTFCGFLGQKYQIITYNSADCDITDLKISTSTKYKEVGAEDLIRVEKDGTIKLIGTGECEVWVRSATNMLDEGVKIKISSSFENQMIGSAVNDWINENIERSDKNAITNDELNIVQSIRLNQLLSFEETELKSILPSLNSVTFDLTNGCDYSSTYGISAGNLEYRFIGSQDKKYTFSLSSAERTFLNLKFENIVLDSKNAISLDTSNVANTSIDFAGVCKLKGADASGDTNSYKGVVSKNLSVILQQNSNVTILGGNGIDSSTSNRTGSSGLLVQGILNINAISSSSTTSFDVSGGNAGHGYYAGDNGGDGGDGIEASEIIFSGFMNVTVKGGNGGNGVAGTDGTDGKSYGDGSWWSSSNGGDGTDGTDGGDGGRGAMAVNAPKLTIDVTTVILTGGDSGNSGRGGDGGDGGKGSNADAVGASGGNGGDGGDGGDSGDVYIGGLATNAEVEISDKTTKTFVAGKTGSVGRCGYKGYAGSGGGTNGWWFATSGSSGDDGYDGDRGEVKS